MDIAKQRNFLLSEIKINNPFPIGANIIKINDKYELENIIDLFKKRNIQFNINPNYGWNFPIYLRKQFENKNKYYYIPRISNKTTLNDLFKQVKQLPKIEQEEFKTMLKDKFNIE